MDSQFLSPREIRRYGKQIMLPEIGIECQEKLKKSSAIVIGAGGLGCPILQYLSAAGIGGLGIVEFDRVDEANLQRQVLYGSLDVGKLKSIIVSQRLEHLNSFVKLDIINVKLDASNSLMILKDYDVVVDATDSFEARYIINDSCVILNKPMVSGAIYKYEGYVSVFNFNGGPTYRCFNPYNPGRAMKDPGPEDMGLLGVLPGITGTWMANEVIKLITGAGTILSGKVLVFNIMNNTFRLISVKSKAENHNISAIGQFN